MSLLRSCVLCLVVALSVHAQEEAPKPETVTFGKRPIARGDVVVESFSTRIGHTYVQDGETVGTSRETVDVSQTRTVLLEEKGRARRIAYLLSNFTVSDDVSEEDADAEPSVFRKMATGAQPLLDRTYVVDLSHRHEVRDADGGEVAPEILGMVLGMNVASGLTAEDLARPGEFDELGVRSFEWVGDDPYEQGAAIEVTDELLKRMDIEFPTDWGPVGEVAFTLSTVREIEGVRCAVFTLDARSKSGEPAADAGDSKVEEDDWTYTWEGAVGVDDRRVRTCRIRLRTVEFVDDQDEDGAPIRYRIEQEIGSDFTFEHRAAPAPAPTEESAR